MLMYRIVLLLLLIGFAPSYSFAYDGYFDADSISPTLLSPPLEVGSREQKNEIAKIVKMQKHPSKKDVEQAKAERKILPEILVEAVVPNLKRDNFPGVYALLDKVGNTSRGVTENAKKYWKAERPYLVDKRVKALVEPSRSNSYPSGHSTGNYVWAHVMNMLLPKYGKEFYANAGIIAQHRALVGMHFLHDLDGGRQLALLIIGGLLQNEEFLQDLKKAKQELRNLSLTFILVHSSYA